MFKHDQVCPFHFHWHKMEDIINRGGGELYVQVYNSNPEEGVAETPVTLSKDGTQDGVRRRHARSACSRARASPCRPRSTTSSGAGGTT